MMGDWKSEIVLFVADADLPPSDQPVMEAFNHIYERAAERGDAEMAFDSSDNDHMLFIDAFLGTYGIAWPAFVEGADIALRVIQAGQCAPLAQKITQWEAAFLADPQPVVDAMRQQFTGLSGPPPVGLDADFVVALYICNNGRGHHNRHDSPAVDMIEALDARTNLVGAANQTFGYLKAMRGWLMAADARGYGLASVVY